MSPHPSEWRMALQRLIINVQLPRPDPPGFSHQCTIGPNTAQKILDALEEVGALRNNP